METKNAYDAKASMEAMDIDKDHAIRYINRNWEHDLTQGQWNEVRPRIVAMLEECDLESDLSQRVGPNYLLKTNDVAFEALDHQFDMTGKTVWEKMHPNLSEEDQKHIDALHWAVGTLVHCNALEGRIKKIVGAGLTCLISKSKWSCASSKFGLGISTIQFAEAAGTTTSKKLLTECLKAYRVLDDFHRWDIEGFMMGKGTLWKMAEGRNLLACFCMIDMQVGPWIEKAQEHLKALGLKVEGILLGEDDILSRSDFEKPLAPGESDKIKLGNFISVIRSKFPLAVINDDMEGCDVGFCTVGGKLLAELAPKMFLSAQLSKRGCKWQLIGSECHAVWLTFGTTFVAPLPMHVGLHLLKAFEKCDAAVFPSKMSNSEKNLMRHWKKKKRSTIWDSDCILPIDKDEEDVKKAVEKKRKSC